MLQQAIYLGNTPKMSKLVYHFTYLLAGLTWGRNFYPHIHAILIPTANLLIGENYTVERTILSQFYSF